MVENLNIEIKHKKTNKLICYLNLDIKHICWYEYDKNNELLYLTGMFFK